MCKVYGFQENNGGIHLYSTHGGVRNYSGFAAPVVCAVVRASEVATGTFSVYVDGDFGTGRGSCTLYSSDYRGVTIGSASASATGIFDLKLNLPQSQVPPWSYQAVVCDVPDNGAIRGVTPVS
jgi:hypothetical protein